MRNVANEEREIDREGEWKQKAEEGLAVVVKKKGDT